MDFGKLANNAFGLRGNLRKVNFRVARKSLSAWVPDDAIFFSMKDVLFNREYEFFPEFELAKPRRLVIDAGSHVGLYSLIAAISADMVLALEPDERNFSILTRNLKENGIRNVRAIKCALWKESGSIPYYLRPNTQLGSLIKRDDRVGEVKVNTISLQELMHLNLDSNAFEVDLMKLDIEGAEFDVLMNSNLDTLSRISRLVVEVHTYVNRLDRLAEKLHRCGFRVMVLKRPFKKPHDDWVSVYDNYRIKGLIDIVNLGMGLTHYHDKSSLLLFGTREPADFATPSVEAPRNLS